MGVSGVRADPKHWSGCVLGGHDLAMSGTGVAKVTGKVGVDLDVKKAKSQDGATIEDNGSKNEPLKLVWRFTEKDWEAAQRIIADINPRKPGARRSPLELKHPRTDIFGLNLVYVENIETPDVEKEIYTVTIDLLEWTPQPKKTKATKTPKAAVQRTIEGPGTFVQLLHPPLAENSGVYNTGPNGSRSVADSEFMQFMQNAM